jgi:hypothetical protein
MVLSQWLYSRILARVILYDFPCGVDTSRIKDVNGVRPLKCMLKALANNVGLITNWQDYVKTHYLLIGIILGLAVSAAQNTKTLSLNQGDAPEEQKALRNVSVSEEL